MQLDGDAALPSDPDHQAEDSAVYLQLAYNYLDCWERWKEGFGGRQWKARRQFEDSLRNWNAELPYEYEGAIACRKSEINHYRSAIAWAFTGLPKEEYGIFLEILSNHRVELAVSRFAEENFSRAIASGLNAMDEGKAHYSIARMRKDKEAVAPLRAAVKALKRHLRNNPYDEEALKLLATAYESLYKTDELYEIRLLLEKAEMLAHSEGQPYMETSEKPITDDAARSGIPFEEKCLGLLRSMGFTASTTTPTNDGGIDIVAIHSEPVFSGKYIVQCKDWKSNVGVTVVRELYGVVNAESANKGILLASSGFTKAAMEFARGKRLELIDGEQLDSLMNRYLENRTAP
jgi:HJR/Mrr/RecB family endonuclease